METCRFSFQIRFGEYAISTLDDDSLWLEHKSGDRMQVWNTDFEDMLKRLWVDEFQN